MLTDGTLGEDAQPSHDAVAFTGTRSELFGRLLRGYLLMLPTLGVYRFWVTTTKRRFYWQNTVVAGEPLEYTGNARQLLIGFLFAVAFFLPIYVAFFVFSTQSGTFALVGYGCVAALLWLLTGYAQYRGRDFRLSRTLWRGIRFDQKGSAWGYAWRRFGWSLLVLVTLGLTYPLMVGNLWRYRYNNTWYGNRQVTFAGSWKTIAGPFYRAYGVVAVTVAAAIGLNIAARGGGGWIGISLLAVLLVAGLVFPYWRSREASRMLSAIRLGDVAVSVHVRARTLVGQYTVFGLALFGVLVALMLVGTMLFMQLYLTHQIDPVGDFRQLAMSGWAGATLVIGGYLVGFASFSLLAETILDFGYWKAVASRATLSNVENLATIRAIDEDQALVGEGLADALNVGSF